MGSPPLNRHARRTPRIAIETVKNQYVGDVNDFLKYGLIRTLTTEGSRPSFVAWLLTPDDLSRDGRKLSYLEAPKKWRHRDPTLFDELQRLVAEGTRSVSAVADAGLLPGALFHQEFVPLQVESRRQLFDDLLRSARGQELVFFDPDNGFEVQSCPAGRKGSDKYLLWRELSDTYRVGHSVLVYQHFGREHRESFTDRIARRIAEATGAGAVFAFATSQVVFFLVAQHSETAYYEERANIVARQWQDLMTPRRLVIA